MIANFYNIGCKPALLTAKNLSNYCMHAFRQIKVGDPTDPANMMGALVSKEHREKVINYVQLARKEGCSVLCGHEVDPLELPERNKNGYFMRPTVITDVSDDSRLMQEEIFGPVTCIVPFRTEEEVGWNNI